LDSGAIQPGPSGEPRVTRLREDLVGLALSGGGIRSVTFALGVLQSLHRFGLLQSVHYLSTVSGGGYIGSSWTAWLPRLGFLELVTMLAEPVERIPPLAVPTAAARVTSTSEGILKSLHLRVR